MSLLTTGERNAADYRKALGIVDGLIAQATGPAQLDRRHDLRHVRTVVYTGRGCQQVVDQLAPLCPCNTGPDTDGPEQDCPIHGDGRSFVDLCRWRDMIVGGAHALLATHDPSRRLSDDTAAVVDAAALARFRELLDAGPWASPMPDQLASPVEVAARAVVARVLAAGDDVRVEQGSAMHRLAQTLGIELATVPKGSTT